MAQIKVQSPDDPELHQPDVHVGVGVVSDVHKVGDSRGVHFLYLGDQEHSGDADELELGTGNATTLQSHKPNSTKLINVK